jgi:archaellin
MPSHKRKGISPIATVIVLVITIVTAALVGYLMYSSTARSARTPIVNVVGQPTLYADGSLYVTLKNDGTAPINMSGATIVVQDVDKKPVQFTYATDVANNGPKTLDPAKSGSYVFKYSGSDKFSLDNIPDGALATLQTPDGYQLSFAVAKP